MAILTLLIEQLRPQESQFSDENGCEEWVTKYNSIAPFILRILSDADLNSLAQSQRYQSEQDRNEEQMEEDTAQKTECFPFGDKCIQQLTVVRYTM